jgi:hypothetical protein
VGVSSKTQFPFARESKTFRDNRKMANNELPSFKVAQTERIFFTDSAKERLVASLNPRLSSEPTQEERQKVEEAAAEERVKGAPQLGHMRALAVQAMAEGERHQAEKDSQFESMYPDSYLAWLNRADEQFARSLFEKTERFRKWVEDFKASFPRPSRAFPVTSVDVASLSIRLGLLETATPAEGKALVEEGIQREDVPFMVSAAANIRSWQAYRGSWMSADGMRIGNDLLDQIEEKTWSVDQYESEYAEEVAEDFVKSWRWLMSRLNGGELVIKPTDITVAALISPLIEPLDNTLSEND